MKNTKLFLLLLHFAAAHRDAPAAFGAGVRFGALSANRQFPAMAEAAVGADFLQTLDIAGNKTAKIAFNDELSHGVTDSLLIFGRKGFDFSIEIDPKAVKKFAAGAAADTVDIGEADFDALVFGEVDPCDTCHRIRNKKCEMKKTA